MLRSKLKVLVVVAVLGVVSSVSAGYFDGSRPTGQSMHSLAKR